MLFEFEGRLGVAERLIRCLDDLSDPALITYSTAGMTHCRVFMIAAS